MALMNREMSYTQTSAIERAGSTGPSPAAAAAALAREQLVCQDLPRHLSFVVWLPKEFLQYLLGH